MEEKNVKIIENEIPILKGQNFTIDKVDDIIENIKNIISNHFGFQLKSTIDNVDKDLIQMKVIKYGLSIHSFYTDEEVDDSIIVVLIETSDAGPNWFDENPNVDDTTFLSNWNVNFNMLIPMRFEIKDACKTNNLRVWDEKYFMM